MQFLKMQNKNIELLTPFPEYSGLRVTVGLSVVEV
jgi:hypothetical protein